MNLFNYIIEDGVAQPAANILEWIVFCELCEKRVAQTKIGETRISTIFLGIDHRFGAGEPLLFETMIFDVPIPDLEGQQWRYVTLDQAKRGHEIAIHRVGEFFPDHHVCTTVYSPGERPADYEERSEAIRRRIKDA